MSYIGNTKIGKMYLGNTEIAKAYLGDDLVFQSGGGTLQPVFYDCLVFDGTAYIDTDIVPGDLATYAVRLGNETMKAAQRVFSFNGTSSTYFGMMYGNSTTSTNRAFLIYYGSSSNIGGSRTLAFSNTTYSFFLTPKRFGFGNTAYTITKGSGTPSGGVVLGVNAAHTGQAYTGTMRAFRIYGSDAQNATTFSEIETNYTPIITLRPCTYGGVPGMWCVETSTFYGNTAGAGNLSVINIE